MQEQKQFHEQDTGAHDRVQTEQYIEVVAGSKDAPVTFQTFAEGGPSAIPPRILHGTLTEHFDELVRLNELGHGVFVMVNEGDGQGRKGENVVAVRAVFIDDDGDGPVHSPSTEAAPPSMVVQSKRGPQSYWVLQPGEPKEAFTPAQVALAKHFGTDPKVKDLPRVMRLPGFFHQKNRQSPYLVTIKEVRPVRYTIKEVMAAYPAPVAAANEPMQSVRAAGPAPRDVPKATRAPDTSQVARRARAYLAKVPGAVQGEHGDDDTYRVACVLVRDFGLSIEDALPLFKVWNEKAVPPWTDEDLLAKLAHAETYGTGEVGSKLDEAAEEFQGTDELCFIVPLGRYYLRLPNGQWDLTAPLTADPAKNHLRSLATPEKAISNAMRFGLMPLAHGIDCSPSDGPQFWSEGRLVINSYKPPRILPTAGDWPRIRAIMEAVTDHDPAGFAWLLNWMAAKYQNPGARSMTAVVFQGLHGLGKTLLGQVMAQLLGPENTASISQDDLDGQFNGHFLTKLFVIADEVVNQENLRDTASILKKYVTDPRIVANVKNTPQFEVKNRMTWWFTSNSIVPVKVEGPTDRRYTVFAALRPPSDDFKAMCEGLFRPDGSFTPEFEREMAAFGHVLATHHVDRPLALRPLRNGAREALINAGRSSAELFLAEVQERGVEAVMRESYAPSGQTPRWDFGDEGVATRGVFDAYTHWCSISGMKACSDQKLGQHIRLTFAGVERHRVTDGAARPWVYRGLPRQGRAIHK